MSLDSSFYKMAVIIFIIHTVEFLFDSNVIDETENEGLLARKALNDST